MFFLFLLTIGFRTITEEDSQKFLYFLDAFFKVCSTQLGTKRENVLCRPLEINMTMTDEQLEKFINQKNESLSEEQRSSVALSDKAVCKEPKFYSHQFYAEEGREKNPLTFKFLGLELHQKTIDYYADNEESLKEIRAHFVKKALERQKTEGTSHICILDPNKFNRRIYSEKVIIFVFKNMDYILEPNNLEEFYNLLPQKFRNLPIEELKQKFSYGEFNASFFSANKKDQRMYCVNFLLVICPFNAKRKNNSF